MHGEYILDENRNPVEVHDVLVWGKIKEVIQPPIPSGCFRW